MHELSRKEREELQRREEILAVAERLFSASGYENTSISDIAKEAEFAVGTIYKFFASKEKLYTAILTKKIKILNQEIRPRIEAYVHAEDKIRAHIKAVLEFAEEHKDFFRIFIMEFGARPQNIQQALGDEIYEMQIDHLEFMVRIFRQGIDEGIFKSYPPRKFIYALDGIIHSFINQHFQDKNEARITDNEDLIADIFLTGALRNRKE